MWSVGVSRVKRIHHLWSEDSSPLSSWGSALTWGQLTIIQSQELQRRHNPLPNEQRTIGNIHTPRYVRASLGFLNGTAHWCLESYCELGIDTSEERWPGIRKWVLDPPQWSSDLGLCAVTKTYRCGVDTGREIGGWLAPGRSFPTKSVWKIARNEWNVES